MSSFWKHQPKFVADDILIYFIENKSWHFKQMIQMKCQDIFYEKSKLILRKKKSLLQFWLAL